MSYTPGTILSFGSGAALEEVVVLTEGKIATKTFAGKPVERREIMSFADWKILAGREEIRTSSEESYPVGTMLRWVADENNKRWAIVLKDGVLQVKEMIMSRTSVDAPLPGSRYGFGKTSQKFFSSLADWKATLPAGGTLTSQAGTDHSLKAKVAAPITATTDAEYINQIKKRFSIRSKITKNLTNNQLRNSSFTELKRSAAMIQTNMEDLKNLTTDTTLRAEVIRSQLQHILWASKSIKKYSHMALRGQLGMMSGYKEAESYCFTNNYRQVLYAFVGDKRVEITASDDLLGLAYDKKTDSASKWLPPMLGKTFAELGIQMKADGKPRLLVAYRRQQIEL